MNPTKIVTWQCPICKSIYDDEQEAIACSSLEAPPHQFKVGDTVYIEERHPDDPKKPLVSVKISEVYGHHRDRDKHVCQYLLEESIRVGKDCLIGSPKTRCDSDHYRPAYEWEFYSLGDPFLGGAIVSEDLVGEEY